MLPDGYVTRRREGGEKVAWNEREVQEKKKLGQGKGRGERKGRVGQLRSDCQGREWICNGMRGSVRVGNSDSKKGVQGEGNKCEGRGLVHGEGKETGVTQEGK